MKTQLHQFWQKFANGLEGSADIEMVIENPAIMQTKNRAWGRTANEPGDHIGRLPFPV